MSKMASLVLAAVLAIGFAVPATPQNLTSLSGLVTDPTGASIPNAVVELENTATGLKRTAQTDSLGAYVFTQVIPGDYTLTVKAEGFSTRVVQNLRLLVNMPATVNVELEVGAVTETVAVTAEAVQLNTTDASIGNAISTRPILQMPLNARNIVSLLALQPGVVFTREDSTNYRNGAVNGGKSDQANVTLDGVDVNDQMDRNAFTSVLRMTPDSVQEFRVTTLNATPDQGRTSGAQVALVTKSGTNELHGSLYHYHRNTATTANSFFNNSSVPAIERPKLIRNIFGASAGGPLIRNRLFLFGNFEGRRDAKDETAVRAVPSMELRQGILQYQRTDGTIVRVGPAEIASRIHARGVNQTALRIMQAYPQPNDETQGDNLNVKGYRFKAPTPLKWNTYVARLDWLVDSASKHSVFLRGNLMNDREDRLPQFPGMPPNSVFLRNNKGIATGLTSVLRPNFISTFRYGLTRQGFENTGIAKFSSVSLRGLDDPVGFTRGFAAKIPVHTIAEDVSWIKGSHTIQFGGVVRIIRNERFTDQNSWSTAVANASWLVDSGAGLNRPFPDMAAASILYFRYTAADVMGLVTQGTARYNYLVDGTVLKEGDPVLRNFAAEEYEMYLQDTWRVTRALTLSAGVRWSLLPPLYEKNGQQVSPNIPIGQWFDLRGGLAQQGRSQMEAGRISFVPRDQGGRPLYPFHKKNFAPRLALVYSPQGDSGLSRFFFGGPGKTAIRVGWGMYYDLFGSGLMRSYDSTAFGLSNTLVNPAAQLDIGDAPAYAGFDQLPRQLLLPAPPAKFPATYPDAFAITNGLDDTIRPPYNMSANFTVAREFGGGLFVQASYLGRFSRRSLTRRDAAMPTDLKDPKSGMTYFQAATIISRLAVANTPVANVEKVPFWENFYSKAATPTLTATQVVYQRYLANLWDWTYALYQLDTPRGQGGCDVRNRCSDLGPWTFFHPQYSYLSVFSSIGGGNYHGGQLTVRKRLGNHGQMEANYTYSKSIDLRSNVEREGSSTGVIWNPWQPGLHKGVSDYDTTHLFNMYGLYALPFGKGRRFASGASGLLNALIGGWEISGIWRWSSGFPISVFSTGVWPTNWNNNNWALWNGKTFRTATTKNAPAIAGRSGPNMFPDPREALAAFDPEYPGGIGTRNPIRGDGVFNIDSSVSKRFAIREGHSLRFIWDAFNLTNTAKFDVFDASLNINAAGTFGKYSSTLNEARVMQFALRYEF
jgi:hypothetical protein